MGQASRVTRSLSALLASALAVGGVGTFGALGVGTAFADTSPTSQSATSLYMNNWDDAVNIWMASKLAQNDTGTYGPRIAEMRIASDYTVNQIKDYSSFFRDETNAVKYDQPHSFNSEAYYDNDGILRTKYLDYGGSNMPVTVTKDFAMVPHQDFTIATFTFTNPGGSDVDYNLLEQIHVNNKTIGGTNSTNSASYDSGRNALVVDMTNSGQYYVALGALQAMDGYQAADDTESNTSQSDVAAWYTFDNNGTVKNNGSVTATDISVAFQDKFTIPAHSSVTRSFVATAQPTLTAVQGAIDTARGHTASYWFSDNASQYSSWLTGTGKKSVSFTDAGLNTAYTRSLVTIKNAINPSYGATPATTNPFAYGYKVWARDSAVTAMALDQAGFHDEAEKYWYWLQDRQLSDGSFKTTFDYWTNNYVSFVEPEHDSIGIFLIGAYLHYKQTNDATFLNNIWAKYKKSADFLWSNLGSNAYGFGVPDASIWEESVEHNAFSQALFAAGLDAAQEMAKAKGLASLADDYNGASSKIRSSIQRENTWSPKGLWNVSGGYYNRAVKTDGTENALVDASSDALIVFGVVDALSSRAVSHISKIVTNLQHDSYGVARYDGDSFYYTSPYSPSGNEAQSDEPSWPQMSTYLALYHLYRGENTDALHYLQWIVSRMGVGFMSAGESVSRITLKPLPSTMVEPVTAAWYVIGALAYEDKADLRIVSPQSNAGAYKAISVTTTVSSDLSQWSNVPYYKDASGDSASGDNMTDIDKVYVSNDASNLYIRIKNRSGALSAYNTATKFGMMVYASDFKAGGASSSSSAMYGGALDHPMQYALGRWSDGADLSRFAVSGGAWSWTNNVSGVTVPQWSTASGDIEMVIPFSQLSSTGSVATGDWSNMDIVLIRQNPSTSAWSEDDRIAIHYRVMTSGEAWYYGNVE